MKYRRLSVIQPGPSYFINSTILLQYYSIIIDQCCSMLIWPSFWIPRHKFHYEMPSKNSIRSPTVGQSNFDSNCSLFEIVVLSMITGKFQPDIIKLITLGRSIFRDHGAGFPRCQRHLYSCKLQVQIPDTMTTRSLCFEGFDSLKLSDISQPYLRFLNSEVTFLFVQD